MNENSSKTEEFVIRPVGYVKSDITEINFRPDVEVDPETRKQQVKAHREQVKNTVSELVIKPEFEELLDGIDAFSHIVILFWPHKLEEDRRKLTKVHPMGRKDLPQQGIFATRSPARPNPILVSSVQLLERSGNILRVKGFEALDQTPIIDIKPVTRHYEGVENPTVPDWIKQISEELESED